MLKDILATIAPTGTIDETGEILSLAIDAKVVHSESLQGVQR